MNRIITGDEIWVYAYHPETCEKSNEYYTKCEAKRKDRTKDDRRC